MPTPKIIRTYSLIHGGVTAETLVDVVKLEHIVFDCDSIESAECPICMQNLDEHSNCPTCGYDDRHDTIETMIEKWQAWSKLND